MLGPDTPVHLRLLEIPQAVKAAEGTAMELDDCAFPLLAGIDIHDDPSTAFDGTNVALLVGARPRSKGMERADLLEANGGIFKPQGEAINAGAADDVSVLVVGNPANTNALIAMSNAPDVPRERFTAMTRLDHNRAIAQLAAQARRRPVGDITRMTIWGNHSATHVPRPLPREGERQATRPRSSTTATGSRSDFIPHRRQARRRDHRGARRVERGLGRQRRDRPRPRLGARDADGDWVSMAVPSDGSYDVPEGLISCFPCTTQDGEWTVVQGLEIDEFSRERIDASRRSSPRSATRSRSWASSPDRRGAIS